MWRCTDCRQEFEEPVECSGPGGSSDYMGMVKHHTEHWDVCPHCGSESVDEFEEDENEAEDEPG